MSNFVDYVKIFCRSGKGGPGAMHMRREKFVPLGGPDGGNGGRGGHIILRGTPQRWTLLHLRYNKHIHADDGGKGEGALRDGADGKDIFIDVPMGTIVKNAETNEQILEITAEGEEQILVQGGRGGKGNAFFKSATRQTPRFAQPGEEHQEDWFIFELKLLADVGLVGFPNVGKSTLLSVVSAAKPEIADYPFTTLQPSLGIVSYRDYQSFVMADIPGIIEGASTGKGLGLRFLKHIERNSVLLFIIPADSKNHAEEYRILLDELTKYNPELAHKQRLIAISKSDLLDSELMTEIAKELPSDIPHLFFSSVTQQGIIALKDLLFQTINSKII